MILLHEFSTVGGNFIFKVHAPGDICTWSLSSWCMCDGTHECGCGSGNHSMVPIMKIKRGL